MLIIIFLFTFVSFIAFFIQAFWCFVINGYGALLEPRRRVKLYHLNRSCLSQMNRFD